jgi:hypothetical protein
MNKKLIVGIIGLVIIATLLGLYFGLHKKQNVESAEQVQQPITLTNGRQCYTYSHEGTPDAPYTTSEFIDMTISGTKVTGTKHGTQSGPDMTNGYEGTLVGDLNGNMLNLAFAYTIEGSQNTEHEIYQAGLTGIDKLRYPLIDKFKDGLFPDTSKAYTLMHYARIECEGSH